MASKSMIECVDEVEPEHLSNISEHGSGDDISATDSKKSIIGRP